MLYKSTIRCTQLYSNILTRQAQMRSSQINKECSQGTCCCTRIIPYANTERSFPDVLISVHAPLPQVYCCPSSTDFSFLHHIVHVVYYSCHWSIQLAHFSCPQPHCVSCPSFSCAAMLMNIASVYILAMKAEWKSSFSCIYISIEHNSIYNMCIHNFWQCTVTCMVQQRIL